MAGQNAVSLLNEASQLKLADIDYEDLGRSGGEDHDPVFKVICYVDGEEFRGKGPNKKEAKLKAAKKAWKKHGDRFSLVMNAR